MPKPKILVIEDEHSLVEVLSCNLEREGFEVLVASDGQEGLRQAQLKFPDLVVLDLMLPGMSGLELLRRRRGLADEAAVIILSARGEEEDRLVGLETGADDYVVKPFSPREMVLRVEALLRRTERLAGTQLVNRQIEVGEISIDLGGKSARCGDRRLSLTAREFDLLAFLASHPGQTFSKVELLRRVWGWEFGDTSTVTVHVRRLREKLEADPSDPKIVLTVGRAGYQLADESRAG